MRFVDNGPMSQLSVYKSNQTVRRRREREQGRARTANAVGKITRKAGLVVGAKYTMLKPIGTSAIPMGMAAGIVADLIDVIVQPRNLGAVAVLDFISGIGDVDIVAATSMGRLTP